MTFRVAAGAIVVREDRLLLVRLGPKNGTQFWIPPGGGMELEEGAFACAERECFEETGIRVKAERLAYVQEIVDERHHHLKLWVYCTAGEGEPHLNNRVPEEMDDLHEARFVSREEMKTMTVVPEGIADMVWEDLANGFASARYLGVKQAKFGGS